MKDKKIREKTWWVEGEVPDGQTQCALALHNCKTRSYSTVNAVFVQCRLLIILVCFREIARRNEGSKILLKRTNEPLVASFDFRCKLTRYSTAWSQRIMIRLVILVHFVLLDLSYSRILSLNIYASYTFTNAKSSNYLQYSIDMQFTIDIELNIVLRTVLYSTCFGLLWEYSYSQYLFYSSSAV